MKHKPRNNQNSRMHRKRRTIKWKFFLYLTGFTGFLLFMLWYFQIVNLNTFYKMIKKSELKSASEKIIDDINSDDLESLITSIADNYDISVNLADTDGNTVYYENVVEASHIFIMSSSQFDEMVQKARDNGGSVMYEVDGKYRDGFNPDDKGTIPPEFNNDNTDQSGSTVSTSTSSATSETETSATDENSSSNPFEGDFGKKNMNDATATNARSVVCVNIVTNSEGKEYVLLTSSMITPVDATVDTLRIQFIYITVIFVVLALGLAFVISQIVSRPLVKINNSAKKLAEGEFDVIFEGTGYKEVQELSATLNYAAEELGRTENLRKELIANVSHDLRTPLTMVTAYSEVMRDIPGENNPENVQVIIDEAKRLTNLVNDMLDLSKLQSGVMDLNVEEYDFTSSIFAVLKRFSKLTEQSGYNVRFEYRDNVKVIADEYKIYQVVYNLINNAINYAGEDKEVVVRQIVHGNIVRLEVEDHGEGISAEEVRNIWDRYYKVDKTHKRAVQGTGLGLSIVQNILRLHDAKFGVNSTPGRGSTFWFELKTVENTK